MVDLRAIEIFLSVCETGSLTAAARQLGITQGAVSQLITRLEKELGVALLDRDSRPPRLLPAGANLRQRGQRLLTDFDDMKHGLERYRKSDVPEFRLGLAESLSSVLLPRLLPMLHEIVGTLSISAGSTTPLVPDLIRGDLDAVLTSEPLDDVDKLELHPLVREPFILILPAGTPAPQTPRDLLTLSRSLPFLWYLRRRRMGYIIDRYFRHQGVEIEQRLAFDSSFTILDAIGRGFGWTISTPLCMVAAKVDPTSFVTAPLPEQRLSRRIDFVAQNGLLALPGQIAAHCIEILESDVKPRVSSYAPFAADQLIIGPD